MATENKQHNEDNESHFMPEGAVTDTTPIQNEGEALDEELVGEFEEDSEVVKLRHEFGEMKDKYLRLYSEFDNFRRRTTKERVDLLKTANQELMGALLPVLDDLERARTAMKDAQDVEAIKEGVELVFNKIDTILQQKGLKPMQSIGENFNAELHEAITQIPAPDEKLKGKIVNEVEKGYFLNDKVIRFAKVIIGA